MSDITYDVSTKYDPDEQFTVGGKLMNKISKKILDLQSEVTALKNAALQQELVDLRMRDKNPAVKDAWDKYQTVLGLARKD